MTAEHQVLSHPYTIDGRSLTDNRVSLFNIANYFSSQSVEIHYTGEVPSDISNSGLVREDQKLKKLDLSQDKLKFIINKNLDFLDKNYIAAEGELEAEQKKKLLFYHILTLNFGTERAFTFGADAYEPIPEEEQIQSTSPQGENFKKGFEGKSQKLGEPQTLADINQSKELIEIIKQKDPDFAREIEEKIKNLLFCRHFNIQDPKTEMNFETAKQRFDFIYARLRNPKERISIGELKELKGFIDFHQKISASHNVEFLDKEINWDDFFKNACNTAIDLYWKDFQDALKNFNDKTNTDDNIQANFNNIPNNYDAVKKQEAILDLFFKELEKEETQKIFPDGFLKKCADKKASLEQHKIDFEKKYKTEILPQCNDLQQAEIKQQKIAQAKQNLPGKINGPDGVSFAINALLSFGEDKEINKEVTLDFLNDEKNLKKATEVVSKLKEGCRKAEQILLGQYEDWLKEFKKMGFGEDLFREKPKDARQKINDHFAEKDDSKKSDKAIELYDKISVYYDAKFRFQQAHRADNLDEVVNKARDALGILKNNEEKLKYERNPTAAAVKKVALAVWNVIRKGFTLGFAPTLHYRAAGIKKSEKAVGEVMPRLGK